VQYYHYVACGLLLVPGQAIILIAGGTLLSKIITKGLTQLVT
jgi:hypothetical protein